jgi:hypothetical protein
MSLAVVFLFGGYLWIGRDMSGSRVCQTRSLCIGIYGITPHIAGGELAIMMKRNENICCPIATLGRHLHTGDHHEPMKPIRQCIKVSSRGPLYDLPLTHLQAAQRLEDGAHLAA